LSRSSCSELLQKGRLGLGRLFVRFGKGRVVETARMFARSPIRLDEIRPITLFDVDSTGRSGQFPRDAAPMHVREGGSRARLAKDLSRGALLPVQSRQKPCSDQFHCYGNLEPHHGWEPIEHYERLVDSRRAPDEHFERDCGSRCLFVCRPIQLRNLFENTKGGPWPQVELLRQQL
jgi:hypothetical protein